MFVKNYKNNKVLWSSLKEKVLKACKTGTHTEIRNLMSTDFSGVPDKWLRSLVKKLPNNAVGKNFSSMLLDYII